jgi:hypothetical protein
MFSSGSSLLRRQLAGSPKTLALPKEARARMLPALRALEDRELATK